MVYKTINEFDLSFGVVTISQNEQERCRITAPSLNVCIDDLDYGQAIAGASKVRRADASNSPRWGKAVRSRPAKMAANASAKGGEPHRDFITLKEAAEIARISRKTLYRWRQEGRMPFASFKLNNKTILVDRASVLSWIASNAEYRR